ncbi:MAG TPA: hypothetical protein VK126_00415, partial [Nitrososphaerales archaeon]|nr:hypothetical protein [Nitrososphaerales archaeon]
TIAQILITTAWGFYINPDTSLKTLARLFVDPALYFSSMLAVTLLSFIGTYAFLRYLKAKDRIRKASAPVGPILTKKWVFIIFILLIVAQVAINGLAAQAVASNLRNMALFDAGAILVTFGIIVHLYRYSQSLPF